MRAETHIRHNNLISIGVLNEWRIGKASVASAGNELWLPGTRTCESHVIFSAHKKRRQIIQQSKITQMGSNPIKTKELVSRSFGMSETL